MPLEISPTDLKTRGGLLDALLEETLDGALVLDADLTILHKTRKSTILDGRPQEEMIGRPVASLDPVTSFAQFLASGHPEWGVPVVFNGRKCLGDLFPVYWQGRRVGAIGVLAPQGGESIRKFLSDGHGLDNMSRIRSGLTRTDTPYLFDDFIGESRPARELLAQCRAVARKRVHPVLIMGETGTGKEILAGAFHSVFQGGSPGPFVKINCAAIPNELLESELFGHEKGAFTGALTGKKGKFELAGGGSILLDEIGDMDLRLQGKLLRVLEDWEFERLGGTKVLPFNARVIASTNRDLKNACKVQGFRADLYYRLCMAEIRIPPLRARREDIPLLARHLLAKARLQMEFTSGALEVMMEHHWPGNVRELRNVIRWLSFLDLDRPVAPEDVRQVLAARYLGVSRTTLYSRMRKHGVQVHKHTDPAPAAPRSAGSPEGGAEGHGPR